MEKKTLEKESKKRKAERREKKKAKQAKKEEEEEKEEEMQRRLKMVFVLSAYTLQQNPGKKPDEIDVQLVKVNRNDPFITPAYHQTLPVNSATTAFWLKEFGWNKTFQIYAVNCQKFNELIGMRGQLEDVFQNLKEYMNIDYPEVTLDTVLPMVRGRRYIPVWVIPVWIFVASSLEWRETYSIVYTIMDLIALLRREKIQRSQGSGSLQVLILRLTENVWDSQKNYVVDKQSVIDVKLKLQEIQVASIRDQMMQCMTLAREFERVAQITKQVFDSDCLAQVFRFGKMTKEEKKKGAEAYLKAVAESRLEFGTKPLVKALKKEFSSSSEDSDDDEEEKEDEEEEEEKERRAAEMFDDLDAI